MRLISFFWPRFKVTIEVVSIAGEIEMSEVLHNIFFINATKHKEKHSPKDQAQHFEPHRHVSLLCITHLSTSDDPGQCQEVTWRCPTCS